MNTKLKCYESKCAIPPVFTCTCQEAVYMCQKHCFKHMDGKCTGKLTPFFAEPKTLRISTAIDSKFRTLQPSDLLSALMPFDQPILQCTVCSRLLPSSCQSSHTCERCELKILNTHFTRLSFNSYTCSQCQKRVHSSFLYPHSDLHSSSVPFPSSADINLLTSLIHKSFPSPYTAIHVKNKLSARVKKQPVNTQSIETAEDPKLNTQDSENLPQKRKNSKVVFEIDD